MDDFFSEMRDTLVEIDSDNHYQGRSDGFLTSYMPNLFAEALIPVNPRHWPGYTVGSVAETLSNPNTRSELGFFERTIDRLETNSPTEKLAAVCNYLETAQSDVQYRDRFWTVVSDTAKVNLMCETGGDFGAIAAGTYSSQRAQQYYQESFEGIVSTNDQEKLNLAIFKQVGASQNVDSSKVVGTGLYRQYVPDYLKDDLCKHPEPGTRPNSFGFSNDGGTNGDDFFGSGSSNNKNPSDGNGGDSPTLGDLDSSSCLLGNSSSGSGSESRTQTDSNDGSIFGKLSNEKSQVSSDSSAIQASPVKTSILPEDQVSSSIESSSSGSDLSGDTCSSNQQSMAAWLFGFGTDSGGSGYCPDVTSASTQCAAGMDFGIPPTDFYSKIFIIYYLNIL